MNILAECLKHADTTNAPKANEKTRAITAAAVALYDLLRPLSGQIVTYNGQEARLNVARGTQTVVVSLLARIVSPKKLHYGDGREIDAVLMQDTQHEIATAEAMHDGTQYVWREFSGVSRGAPDLERLGAHVAATIGPLLKVEV